MGVPIALGYREDAASGAQIVDGGLRFDRSKTHIVRKTFSSSGNRKTWTLSFWHKKTDNTNAYNIFTAGRGASTRPTFEIVINGSGEFVLSQYNGSGYDIGVKADGVYRDTSAWYHFVVVLDTTQSTDSNKVKIWVNGQQRTVTATAGGSVWPTTNTDLEINNGVLHNISANAFGDANPMNGYVCLMYMVDGQALDASYFGYTDPLTNVWRPKKYTGNYNYSAPTGTLLNYNSNTALPTYSNQGGGSANSSYPVSNGFDGSASTYCDMTYLNGQWSKLTFGQAITNVTNITIGYDGEGDIGYNGSVTNSSVGFNGSRQTITLYSGSAITLTDLYFVSQAGNGVCRLYDVTITTSTVSATELTFTAGTGINSFYLPFDGSAPIGQDQSGRGNNWTPVNFGGSNTIEKATGALPILNTDGGGKVARVGVRTDAYASNLVLALPLVGIKSDFSNAINSGTSNKTITVTNAVASSTQSVFYSGSFYFDGTGDYMTIPDNTDLNFGNGDFTIEGWAYSTNNVTQVFGPTNFASAGTFDYIIYDNGGKLGFAWYPANSGTAFINSTNNWPLNTWFHWAVTRSGNTFRLFINGNIEATGTNSTALSHAANTIYIGRTDGLTARDFNGYQQDIRVYKGVAKYTSNFIPASTDPDIVPDSPSGVSYSSNVALVPSTDGAVAFDGSGDYLSIADSADFELGSGDFTIEFLVNTKQSNSSYYTAVSKWQSSNLSWMVRTASTDIGSGWSFFYSTSGSNYFTVFGSSINDGRWHHIAVTRSGNTFRTFTDGILNTSTDASVTLYDGNASVVVGSDQGGNYFEGFISNLHIVKGTALYTSNFTPPSAPISSVANTKLLCCKSNSSATAADVTPGSITATNAVPSNFNPFTANINTQRGKQSGYATWNPLDQPANASVSNGNLTQTFTSYDRSARANMSVSSGKWFWEIQTSAVSGGECFGIQKDSASLTVFPGGTGGYGYYSGANVGTARFYDGGSYTSYGTTTVVGDVVNVALDLDSNQITFYKNGISQGTKTIVAGTYFPSVGHGSPGTTTFIANFGQKPFKFPPPAGFQPLTLANTPRPTIVRPDQFVGVTTYSGNTPSSQSVNVGFKPDMVWLKVRNAADYHQLYDSVRGATNYLHPNVTNAEATDANALTAFTRTGFNVGSTGGVNSNNMVAWAWKAGGNSNTFNIDDVGYSTASAAGLTAGTIAATGASIGTKLGFSIIKYRTSGSGTVPHGLTQAPEVSLAKRMNGTGDWYFRVNIGSVNGYMLLNGTGALTGSFSVTSTTVQGADFGSANEDWILYNWHSVPGFSKFGTYTGNLSADGVFVQTGFRPRWILLRRTAGQWWFIYDSVRYPSNQSGTSITPYISTNANTEGTTNSAVDFLSNGFKLRVGDNATNDTSTFIYCAFAESPTFNLYGAQANAR